MKIFVTVGTTPFDELINYIDTLSTEHDITLQISDKAKYIPKNKKYFNFTNEILDYYNGSDLVITHAGAGSIYKLLELNKKIIIVPNMTRVDKHQMDIAKYMEKNNFALVCHSIENLSNLFTKTEKIKKYDYEPFSAIDNIMSIVEGLYK